MPAMVGEASGVSIPEFWTPAKLEYQISSDSEQRLAGGTRCCGTRTFRKRGRKRPAYGATGTTSATSGRALESVATFRGRPQRPWNRQPLSTTASGATPAVMESGGLGMSVWVFMAAFVALVVVGSFGFYSLRIRRRKQPGQAPVFSPTGRSMASGLPAEWF